jgi:lactoylglutathione lyase
MDSRVGYINVGVRDLERSVAFYRDVLGFKLESSSPEFSYARFDVNGFRLGMGAGEVDQFTGRPPGGRHTGIGLTVQDVNAAYNELKGKGVEFPMVPAKMPWGGFMGIFSDPDGNLFYLDQAE